MYFGSGEVPTEPSDPSKSTFRSALGGLFGADRNEWDPGPYPWGNHEDRETAFVGLGIVPGSSNRVVLLGVTDACGLDGTVRVLRSLVTMPSHQALNTYISWMEPLQWRSRQKLHTESSR